MSNKTIQTPAKCEIEQSDIGPQFVIDDYRPVSLRERLDAMAGQPKRFRRAEKPALQKPCDIGLLR